MFPTLTIWEPTAWDPGPVHGKEAAEGGPA